MNFNDFFIKRSSGVIWACVVFTCLTLNCVSPNRRSLLRGSGVLYSTEGWIGGNTLRVRSLGAPNAKAKGFVRRRTQSEEAALLSAQKRVIELLAGAEVSGTSSSDSGESNGIKLNKSLSAVVKGGMIMEKSFDEDDNCSIVYEVHATDLKQKSEAFVRVAKE